MIEKYDNLKMGNYLKLFDLTSEYLAYVADISKMILPNVSLCKDNLAKIYYNARSGSDSGSGGSGEEQQVEVLEGAKILCKYNIEDVDNDSELFNNEYQASDDIESIKIDGVELDSVVNTYRFETIGEHDVLFTLKDGITSIDAALFSGVSGLTSVIIGDSVTSIGESAFSSSNLTSITIPNSVTLISQEAFGGCPKLTSITIPDSVTSIDSKAFYGCDKLTIITCNATTAPTIGNETFLGVAENGTLTVPVGSTGYDVWMGTGDDYLGKYNWTKVEA